MDILNIIGRILVGKKIDRIKNMLEYADVKYDPFKFAASNVLVSILLVILTAIIVNLKFGIFYSILSSAGIALGYYFIVFNIISLIADQRAKYVEKVLPDVLLLMASNLRSGVPPDEALLLSARPEFGFLSKKIKQAGKKIASGSTMQEALASLKKGIRSKIFVQTIDLIVEGLNSGGEISVLLEETANDIRDMSSIRKEVKSMILTYAFFIFIASCLIAPILYAVSIQLAEVLSKLSNSIAMQFLTEKAVAVKLSPSNLSSKFLTNFAYVNLIILSTFSSFIAALINKGDEKYGIQYIPFFLIISLVLFYVAKLILTSFFGGIRVV